MVGHVVNIKFANKYYLGNLTENGIAILIYKFKIWYWIVSRIAFVAYIWEVSKVMAAIARKRYTADGNIRIKAAKVVCISSYLKRTENIVSFNEDKQ